MTTINLKQANLRTLLAMVLIFVGSVGLDQVSKDYAQSELMTYSHEENIRFYKGQQIPLVSIGDSDRINSSFFLGLGLNYVRNPGAAWGALSNLPDSIRIPFFYLVTLVAVIIIGLYLKNTPWGHRLARFSLVLILSGAVGNFVDRVVHGYVIDWIDVRWNIGSWRYDFPNFNFADSAITVGVSFLIFDIIVLESRRQKKIALAAQT